ncbi:hypothetical protein BU649_09465 [Staphylococcus chromogenes]|nr:hypothetical protein [Staphylococcus chromogenes]PTG01959.1 hypothetical protein BU649_09465 [Staphylococcus chromogenes]PTG86112.1 hypothetical protein BU644_04110 [Staphylococcus chromogenes]PTH03378.1 hypothetical protein BU635_02315 [Staphylococcus chromogenes]RIM01121.1 hypothetical protein BU683_11705 [Staphylococcus chromogenes]
MSDDIIAILIVLVLFGIPSLYLLIIEMGWGAIGGYIRPKSRTERIVRKEVKRLEREIKERERLKDLYKRLEQLQERDK